MRLFLLLPIALASCAAVQDSPAPLAPAAPEDPASPLDSAAQLPKGALSDGPAREDRRDDVHFLQGFGGVSDLGDVGGRAPIPGGEVLGGDIDEAPYLGGALQWGLAHYGDTALGLEGGASLTLGTFGVDVVQGAGTQAADADLVGGALFLGAFASHERGRWRVYGGLGPLVQLVRFDVDYDDGAGGGRYADAAIGLGYYVRAGVERRLTEGLLLGLGARWFDADLDFSDEFDGVDFSGTQLFLTLSQSF